MTKKSNESVGYIQLEDGTWARNTPENQKKKLERFSYSKVEKNSLNIENARKLAGERSLKNHKTKTKKEKEEQEKVEMPGELIDEN